MIETILVFVAALFQATGDYAYGKLAEVNGESASYLATMGITMFITGLLACYKQRIFPLQKRYIIHAYKNLKLIILETLVFNILGELALVYTTPMTSLYFALENRLKWKTPLRSYISMILSVIGIGMFQNLAGLISAGGVLGLLVIDSAVAFAKSQIALDEEQINCKQQLYVTFALIGPAIFLIAIILSVKEGHIGFDPLGLLGAAAIALYDFCGSYIVIKKNHAGMAIGSGALVIATLVSLVTGGERLNNVQLLGFLVFFTGNYITGKYEKRLEALEAAKAAEKLQEDQNN